MAELAVGVHQFLGFRIDFCLQVLVEQFVTQPDELLLVHASEHPDGGFEDLLKIVDFVALTEGHEYLLHCAQRGELSSPELLQQ